VRVLGSGEGSSGDGYAAFLTIYLGASMRLRLTCLLLLIVGSIFLFDALTFPNQADIESASIKVNVSIRNFTRSKAGLTFVDSKNEQYNIRCDLNKNLCQSWREFSGQTVTLTIIKTSTLGDYIATSLQAPNHKVSYLNELRIKLPNARFEVWLYPILFLLFLIYYASQLFERKK